MNLTNYRNLKFRIHLWFSIIVLVIFSISSYPIYEFVTWLSDYYNVVTDKPLRGQENAGIFSLGVAVFSLIVISVVAVFVTFCIAKIYGYSRQQCIDYFFRYENLPSHWMKR